MEFLGSVFRIRVYSGVGRLTRYLDPSAAGDRTVLAAAPPPSNSPYFPSSISSSLPGISLWMFPISSSISNAGKSDVC